LKNFLFKYLVVVKSMQNQVRSTNCHSRVGHPCSKGWQTLTIAALPFVCAWWWGSLHYEKIDTVFTKVSQDLCEFSNVFVIEVFKKTKKRRGDLQLYVMQHSTGFGGLEGQKIQGWNNLTERPQKAPPTASRGHRLQMVVPLPPTSGTHDAPESRTLQHILALWRKRLESAF